MKDLGQAIEQLSSHWAVAAIGKVGLERAHEVAKVRLVRGALNEFLDLEFSDKANDDELLGKVALAYEMAAIEGWNAYINPTSTEDALRVQCAAGAAKAFEFRRLDAIPTTDELRVLHVLHLASLAYCGERWPDLRRWFAENEKTVAAPSVSETPWDRRLLFRIYDCWVRLFRKRNWDDVDRIREIIAGLRHDQKTFESRVLETGDDAEDRAMALRLLSLYSWAKGTELLATYMLQGEPTNFSASLNKHFEAATKAATMCNDASLETLLRWLHAAAGKMAEGSLWRVAHSINSRVTNFVKHVTSSPQRSMFELLPPQQAALVDQGLLNVAKTAIVVEMPTSGGKTLLAQFKILQTLNQFADTDGWVAYVVPTRALSAQITRQLRRDFEPIGVKVEQLTGAVDIDSFEEAMLAKTDGKSAFDVLIATPEKLQLVIRNKKVPRPLRLVVLDEAHNIEDKQRGLRIELLLATIKGEYQDQAHFMLLMPFVEKAETLARWLAGDVSRGNTISLGTTPWKPNERIVGMYNVEKDDSQRAGWRLTYETLVTSPKTLHLKGVHDVGDVKPLNIAWSSVNATTATGAMAKVMSRRATSIAVAMRIGWVWNMARTLADNMSVDRTHSEKICLVQNFLRTEFGDDFELIRMLERRIGVHHAGLSDETRALMEWLAEVGELKVLCSTTTIVQGINFPVGSVFLQTIHVPSSNGYTREMTPREFWNLAGRAGRVGHDSVGVVGIAASKDPQEIRKFVSRATGTVVSRLVGMLEELEQAGRLLDLERIIYHPDWDDFRCYVAHLFNEKKSLDAVIAEMDLQLRNTFGYTTLRSTQSQSPNNKAEQLLKVTKAYVAEIAKKPGFVALADKTGFSVEGVGKAMNALGGLDRKLKADDWMPESLFGTGRGMADVFGVMLQVPQISVPLDEIKGKGIDHRRIADIARDWVSGARLDEIAKKYFADNKDSTIAMSEACRAIYKAIVNNGTWGFSALSQLGLDFETLSVSEKRKINALPAMMYHGVRTEEAVLMRMNNAPRSIAENLGSAFREEYQGKWEDASVQEGRAFLQSLSEEEWEKHKPQKASISGSDYRKIWRILSGEP